MLDDIQVKELSRLDRGIEESRQEVERARRAQELMDDPLMVEAFQVIEDKWTQAWKHSRRVDADAREEAYRALAAAMDLRGFFQVLLEQGKNGKAIMEQKLRERENLLSRLKKVVGL